MFPHTIKTNIAVHLLIFFFLSMLLIDFVMIITAQNDLINFEISKGKLCIAGMEAKLMGDKGYEKPALCHDMETGLAGIVEAANLTCALVMDINGNRLFGSGKNCRLNNSLGKIIKKTMTTGKRETTFSGSTWGVVWKQERYLIQSAPVSHNNRIFAGIGIVLPLEGVYKILRRTQHILFVYILINTAVLTLAGLYLISRVTVKPLQRLVKRADEYKEEDEAFFFYGKEDNEFRKLSKALNSMMQKIAGDRKKLRETVKSLEMANTGLKNAQRDIIRGEKLASVGRLSSGIAHEIGNPVGIVAGYIELLKPDDITDLEKHEYLSRAESEIERISSIIRQLLDLSKPSGDGAHAISVHHLLEDTLKILNDQPMTSKIRLKHSFSAGADTVWVDPSQLRQVFLNLVINAVDAISSGLTGDDGEIFISTSVESGLKAGFKKDRKVLQIEFADNGPGIAGEDLGNIFDPFYTTKEPGKGTGLGLAVCFMIIDGMGGKIKGDSIEGKGTTMTIYLPLYEEC